MKHTVFFMALAALLCAGINSYGQELKAYRCAGGKWGFTDRSGSVVIVCKYDKIGDWFFYEGVWLAPVKLNGAWGCINEIGDVVVPIQYPWRIDAKRKTTLKIEWERGRTERERLERERPEQIRRNSFSFFSQKYFAQEMNNWLQKGEFEKTADWQQRISDDSRKAKEAGLLREAEQAFIAEHSKNMPVGSMALGAYDADKETFLIANSVHGDWFEPVPVNDAPDFKNNWENFVKIPQYVIRNDQLAFAGYKFETADTAVAGNHAAEQKEKQTVSDVSVRQGKAAIGGNLIYGTGGSYSHFGIGGKVLFNANDRFRFAGEFDYFPKQEHFSMWDFSAYGHLVLSGKEKKAAFYPLAGIGMTGLKVEQSESFSGMVFSFGGGIDVNLSSSLTMNFELRFKRIDFSDIDVGGYRTNFVAGLAYRF